MNGTIVDNLELQAERLIAAHNRQNEAIERLSIQLANANAEIAALRLRAQMAEGVSEQAQLEVEQLKEKLRLAEMQIDDYAAYNAGVEKENEQLRSDAQKLLDLCAATWPQTKETRQVIKQARAHLKQ